MDTALLHWFLLYQISYTMNFFFFNTQGINTMTYNYCCNLALGTIFSYSKANIYRIIGIEPLLF